MKKSPLINLLYSAIAIACIFLVLDLLVHPFGNVAAFITLLVACYYIGKYGK